MSLLGRVAGFSDPLCPPVTSRIGVINDMECCPIHHHVSNSLDLFLEGTSSHPGSFLVQFAENEDKQKNVVGEILQTT